MDEDKYSIARMPGEVKELLVALIEKLNQRTHQNDIHSIDEIKNVIREEMLSQTEISNSVALKVQVQTLRSLRHLLMNYYSLSDSSSPISSTNIYPSASDAALSTHHAGPPTRHDSSSTRQGGPPTKRMKSQNRASTNQADTQTENAPMSTQHNSSWINLENVINTLIELQLKISGTSEASQITTESIIDLFNKIIRDKYPGNDQAT